MVDFSSELDILAEIKCKSGNKGLIHASWLSPSLCRRSCPLACLKLGHQVWAPPWPSCRHWAGVQSQQENLLLRPGQGGLLAASQPGSKNTASSRVYNLYWAWLLLLFSCHFRGWFLSGLPEHYSLPSRPPVLEMGLKTEIASSSGRAPDILPGEGHGQPE